MQLKDFYDYKNKLMEDMLTTPSIVSLLDDEIKDPTNIKEAKKLKYKQVFPFEYIPDTIEDGDTFICFEVDLMPGTNKTFYQPVIYVWEFSHRSKLVLPNGGGVRTDILASEIAEKLNGSRFYGLGELNLHQVRRYAPMTDFNGKIMTFHAVDFNRRNPNQHPIPQNRKGL